MKIKGDPDRIAQYQKALGGNGTVSFQGVEASLRRDSRRFRSMFGQSYERKLPPTSRPGKGVRHEYYAWRKRFQIAEGRFLEMLG